MKPLLGLNAPMVVSPLARQAQAVTTSTVVPAIQTAQWCRNGKHPDAGFESLKAQSANFAALFRTKEICRWAFPGFASGSDAVYRRWAFHTGPYAHALNVMVTLAPSGAAGSACGARLDLFPGDGSPTVSQTYTYGPTPIGVSVLNSYLYNRPFNTTVDIKPDTDYTAQLVCTGNGGIANASIGELASLTEAQQGNLPENFAQGSNIYADNRAALAQLTSALWTRGGAHIFNWCSGAGVDSSALPVSPLVTTSNTPKNMLDPTVTTISPSSPGPLIDLTGKDRLGSAGGVDVVFAAFGNATLGGASEGHVFVSDQNGNLLAQLDFSTGASPVWTSTEATLPATLAKYDLQFSADASTTFNLYAMSAYELE